MASPERNAEALLIERLLGEASFRERFHDDPVGAFREAGIDGPPEALSRTAGRAMETLEIRESRSSLGGVMMAAAVEALSVFALADHVSTASAAELPHRASGGSAHFDAADYGQAG